MTTQIANRKTKAQTNSPDPVDVHVGKRLRLRRTILGMSQEQLARAIGVSFQQVQKYEHGTNRISASRLYDISRMLGVPISFFFQDIGEDIDQNRVTTSFMENVETNSTDDWPSEAQDDPMSRSETLELVRSYWRIGEKGSRRKVLDLIKVMGKAPE